MGTDDDGRGQKRKRLVTPEGDRSIPSLQVPKAPRGRAFVTRTNDHVQTEIGTPTKQKSTSDSSMDFEDFAGQPLLQTETEVLETIELLAALLVKHDTKPTHLLTVHSGMGRGRFHSIVELLVCAQGGEREDCPMPADSGVQIAQRIDHKSDLYTHIACYDLIVMTEQGNMRQWAADWADLLTSGGRLVIDLRWKEGDKSWTDVAYRYATMASEIGLRLDYVNGCSLEWGLAPGKALGQASKDVIADQYSGIADQWGLVNAHCPRLQLELKWRAARLRQNLTVDNIIALSGRMYGTFSRL